ncbi:hypothetical protein FA13DRAFT_283492 [Coprinellus micaceus]|uniref:Uncharacterized protein n=1 Tax=Coprinellus micaceus TaxID=71717 RepID=A0A4Y7TEW5_COPMI|nr:hypothetical protein FA13DRAFT_283492 [Coprinellus micaceus]
MLRHSQNFDKIGSEFQPHDVTVFGLGSPPFPSFPSLSGSEATAVRRRGGKGVGRSGGRGGRGDRGSKPQASSSPTGRPLLTPRQILFAHVRIQSPHTHTHRAVDRSYTESTPHVPTPNIVRIQHPHRPLHRPLHRGISPSPRAPCKYHVHLSQHRETHIRTHLQDPPRCRIGCAPATRRPGGNQVVTPSLPPLPPPRHHRTYITPKTRSYCNAPARWDTSPHAPSPLPPMAVDIRADVCPTLRTAMVMRSAGGEAHVGDGRPRTFKGL